MKRRLWKLYLCACLFAMIISDGQATELCLELDEESILHKEHEYLYRLQAQVVSELSETENDRSEITVGCDILITYSHSCFYKLQMLNCSSDSRNHNEEPNVHVNQNLASLSRYPVMFFMSGGVISDVHSDPSDPVFSVNMKKGVLSVFVFRLSMTAKEMKEIQADIHGSCSVTSIPGNKESGSVMTYRDLRQCISKGCTDPLLHSWSLISSKNFIKHTLSSSVECQYKINLLQKTIEEVLCNENHSVKMNFFQETSESTRTSIYYKIEHLRTTKLATDARYKLPIRKADIFFECSEALHPNENSSSFLATAERMLKDLIEISQNEIKLSSIGLFKTFAEWLRTSNDVLPFVESISKCSSDSSSLYEICSSDLKKDLAISYLTDGLIECNTVPCIEAVSYLSIKNFLPDVYLDYILYSWSNMNHYKKSEITNHVMNICLEKNSRFCWLILGTLVKKSMMEQSSLFEIPTSLRKIASYYDEQVSSTCRSCSSSVYFSSMDEQHTHLYTFLKAIGNMGEFYSVLVPDGVLSLLTCFNSTSLPVFQKTAVLETLKKLNVCNNSEMCKIIHSKLFPGLVQQNEEVDLRMHIFELFMLHPKKFDLLPIIIKFLKEYENSQMKAFIASYLETKMQDRTYTEENSQFIQELLHELQEHKIELSNFYQGKEKKSTFFANEGTFGLPFLAQEINKFGVKFDTLTIYRIYNMIPHFLRSNVAMHFFSKLAHIAQFGVHFEGFNDMGKIFMKTLHEIGQTKSQDFFRKLISALFEMLSSLSSKEPSYKSNYHLDEIIMNNIKKIHSIYKAYNPEASPLFHAYLDIFGNTLNFLSLGDIVNFISGMKGCQEVFNHLQKGIVFNTSRIVRLISAQHQVPTMTGLPLTWSSDVTLAFSQHSKAKMGLNEGIEPMWSTDVLFQPSAALTSLNKVVWGAPKIMLSGILSNSSYYTSTHWKAGHVSTGSGKTWKLDIEKPEVLQTLLQHMFQNELLEHSSSEDITYCDYKKSSEWCFNDGMSSVFGLKACQEQSDEAGDRNHLKTFSGCHKWGIYVYPYDSKLKTYSFEVSKKSEFSRDETELRLHTPDTAFKREVTLSLFEDKKNMENSLNLRVPTLPDFFASVSSKYFHKKNRVFGCKVQAILQLSKDSKYDFIYKNSAGNENTTEIPSYTDFGNEITHQIHESTLQLETSFNMYKLIKKTRIEGGSSQQSIMASYSNVVSEWNWLSRILPSDFWETNSKAWVQVNFNSTATKLEKDELSSLSSLGYVRSPHAFFLFSQTSLAGPGIEQMHFSLGRMKTESSELITFLNATYNFLNSGTDLASKEIRIFNLTVPLKSWSVQIEKNIIINESKMLYDITFSQSTMISKDNTGETSSVKWWHYNASDKFEVKEKKYRFKMDLTDMSLHDIHPVEDSCASDDKNVFPLMNKITDFDIKLLYPHDETEEQVTCHGKYITSTGLDFRFQLDFTLYLSRMNLKMDSSSLYKISKGLSEIFHTDILTYEKTGAKAVYNMFAKFSEDGDCNDIIFSHNISSYIVDFLSNVSYQCKPDDPKLHVLLLNIDSSSTVWNALNSELRQIIEDINHEYSEESMNYSTPLIIINVTADWRGARDHYDHTKKAVFTSLWDKIPSFEINYNSMMDGHRIFQINFHDEKEVGMLCNISTQYLKAGNFQVEIKYSDAESNYDWMPFIRVDSILENTDERIWTGEINRALLQNVVLLFKNTYLKAGEIMSSVSSGSSHPLNQALQPMLNATLSEYWTSLRSQGKATFNLMLLEMEKVVKSLEPLYFPVISVIYNSFQGVKTVASYLSLILKHPSETKWNYPSFLNYVISRIHQHISEVLFYVDYTNQQKIAFKFRSLPLLQILKSYSYRVFSPLSPMPNNLVSVCNKGSQQFYQKAPGSKVALIYGGTQMYSFDGRLYEFPNNIHKFECIYLLSHDVQKSAFSVAASRDSMQFIFPTMTISITWENEVYINGSKQQQGSLPIRDENGAVMVRREGEIIFVQSPFLNVMCDGRNRICALEISGWNSGKVLGLLGNADGELHNEYMLPDGKIASNALEFATAYELTDHKECKTTANLVKLKEIYDVKEMCRRRGGQQENEEENVLTNHCSMAKGVQATSQDTCEGDMNKYTDVAFTSKAISAICYLEGFGTKISSDFQGGKQEIKPVKNILEIVLLVDEHSLRHHGGYSYINIENILAALQKKFHSENYLDVQYSLIGFGGKGVHYQPSIHAVDNNTWVPYKVLVDRLLKTLEFNGMNKLDPVIPMKYAAESLGYDTFGSKIFIVFTNKDEKQTDQEMLETSVQHLLKNGITVYVFAIYSGIQKEGIFGIRHNGSLIPSSETMDVNQKMMHNGNLAKIAFATEGIIFFKGTQDGNSSLEHYSEFAQEVWNKVKKEEALCRNCKEVQGMWWNNYQKCTIQNC